VNGKKLCYDSVNRFAETQSHTADYSVSVVATRNEPNQGLGKLKLYIANGPQKRSELLSLLQL
jgi:hypothetical protein